MLKDACCSVLIVASHRLQKYRNLENWNSSPHTQPSTENLPTPPCLWWSLSGLISRTYGSCPSKGLDCSSQELSKRSTNSSLENIRGSLSLCLPHLKPFPGGFHLFRVTVPHQSLDPPDTLPPPLLKLWRQAMAFSRAEKAVRSAWSYLWAVQMILKTPLSIFLLEHLALSGPGLHQLYSGCTHISGKWALTKLWHLYWKDV